MFETKIPLGTYHILGARGDTWYGPEHLFGPPTSYFVIRKSKPNAMPPSGDDEFVLSQTGNTIDGVHMTFRRAAGGTIAADPIAAAAFRQ